MDAVSTTATTLGDDARAACSLVVGFDPGTGNFPASTSAAISLALDHGLLVVLAHDHADDRAYYDAASPLVSNDRGVLALYDRWPEIAETVARHDPGPAVDLTLTIEGFDWEGREPQVLLRRALAELGVVRLEEIPAGRSGAKVWIAYPRGHGVRVRPLPYLIKFNSRQKIRSERVSFLRDIRDAIPFDHRPNVDHERSVEGSTLAVLVQDFVDRAASLRSALPHSNPAQLVASVFDGALRGCLSCSEEQNVRLSHAFAALNVLRWDALEDVAARARSRYATGRDITQLRALVEGVTSTTCRTAIVHGDLHLDNIFVSSGSSHVILIDFGRVTTAPVVADFACLDVSVGLTGVESISDEALRKLYSPPLTPVDPGSPFDKAAWINRTLRAIRHAVLLAEPLSVPYVFAVGCYLLRFASYEANGSLDRRALAFHLSAALFESLA